MPNKNDEQSVKETKDAIKKAQETLEKISKDEHERYLAELREKYIMDQKAVQEYGYLKGIEEGKEQGIEQGKTETIKTLIENGMSISQVAKMLKMDIKDIEKMIEK